MEIISSDASSPQDCMALIYEFSGQKVEPNIASELWPKIMQHKWVLSEKLGRDVGMKVACLDFIDNVEPIHDLHDAQRIELLKALGAQMIDRSIWDTISETQPPKQIVNKRIILPLTAIELARKHAVILPLRENTSKEKITS